MNKDFIIKILRYFISLLYISLLFNYFSGFLMTNIINNILICLLISFIFTIIDLLPKGKWLSLIILSFIAIYAIAQINFKGFMGNYMSFVQATDGATRITDYIIQFIAYIKIKYYLILLPVPINIYLNIKQTKPTIKQFKYSLILLLCAISLCIAYPLSYYSSIEKNLATNGLIPFLIMDIAHVFTNTQTEEEIIIEPIIEPTITPEIITNEEEEHRLIDDNEWKQAIANETNESILSIDNFLINKPVSDYNDYTAMFEGKNLIMIMIEAFDYLAIDKQLTPTLYKMKTEGWFFNNYYAPKYSCTTGESEFISLTSLVPENNTCAPNDYNKNTYPGNVFNLFKQEGYYTSAYHNWKDEFYERRSLYANMGCDNYYNYDDLDYTLHKGWPSDIELFDYSYELYKDKAPFMSLIVTSTTHFPYDQDSWSADLNIDKINEVHPDYPINIKRYLSKAMILDEGLNHLLTNLSNDGLLEDTVIIMYADHHPLKTDLSLINTYSNSGYDRLAYDMAIDRSPLIIYGGNIETTTYDGVMSTFDILPTLANLYDLNYDPRIYMGMDYFASEDNIVIFANGSWVINEGYYSNIKEEYISFDDTTLSDEKIKYYNTIVQNSINASSKILRLDYFKNRDFPIKYKN